MALNLNQSWISQILRIYESYESDFVVESPEGHLHISKPITSDNKLKQRAICKTCAAFLMSFPPCLSSILFCSASSQQLYVEYVLRALSARVRVRSQKLAEGRSGADGDDRQVVK